MPKTHAERQRDYRQRQADRIACLEAGLAETRAQLAEALAEIDRLSGRSCQHPSGAVDDTGTCQLCGADLL